MITTLRKTLVRLIGQLPPRLQAAAMALRSRGAVATGQRAYVHRSAQILGKASVSIGANSVISEQCWLNVNHRGADGMAIAIGDHCFIGRRNFFSSGRHIGLGHYVLTANDCHFLGSSHDVSDPMRPCITTGTTASDVILVGHNTFIGAGARILGHVTIGHGCVIGAGALVTKDVPPFSQVSGFPAQVGRRFSFARGAWIAVSDFTADDAAALPDADTYLRQLRQHPAPKMPYIAAGSDMGDC